jgi:DHA3 family macrolide efflux protein-like MFS transporter
MCEGAFGVGMLVGSAGLMALGEKLPLSRVIAGCAVALGVLVLACGLLPSSLFPVLVLCAVLAGACCAGFAGPATTLLQKNCNPEYLGRVMGIFNSAMSLGMPIGTAIGGAVAGFTGVQLFIVADGVAMLVVGVLAVLSRHLKSLDRAQKSVSVESNESCLENEADSRRIAA